jgi:hypothetical protein
MQKLVNEPETAEGPEEIGEWLVSVAHDPVRFVAEGFAWGEGELARATGPEPWQLWLLEQIKAGLMTPGQAVRIAIASGHGIGKSACCAWITLWAISTSLDCRGIVTASSESMLMTRFRAELRVWVRRFRAADFFEMTATSLVSRDPDHEQTWRVDLLPWNANRPEAFAGLHNAGRRILVIMDEASAIEAPIWETLEAVVTDADGEVIWLCAGPLRATGRFRDCFDRLAGRWVTKHVNSLDVSFTNKAELRRWGEDYGEDSDFFRTRVLGEFPRVGSDQFISPEMVDEAMGRELEPSFRDPLVVGIDVARFGTDESVLFARRGMNARSIPPMVYRGLPLDQLEDRIVAFCNAHGPVQQLFIDGTGLGGGLVDHLRRRGFLVTDVQFGAKAIDEIDGVRYANMRAYIWGRMRAALKYLCLPHSPALKEQLCAPEYSFSRTTDAILLEPKESLRRRGEVSPDQADALACTFGGEIATLPALADWVQPQGVVWDYDPFSEQAMRGDPYPEGKRRYTAPGWAPMKEWDPDEGAWREG